MIRFVLETTRDAAVIAFFIYGVLHIGVVVNYVVGN